MRWLLVFALIPRASGFTGTALRPLAFEGSRKSMQLESVKEPFVAGSNKYVSSRRSMLDGLVPILTVAAAYVVDPLSAKATDHAGSDDLIDVYFGCGCFWHVQHEFVEAERQILGRSDKEISARAGYAGGRAGSDDGKVCYHNAAFIADYGQLGHAEIVSLRIPPSKFEEFAVEYFKLFDKEGFRPDQFGDKGSEYRNLIGIPGGARGELSQKLVKASVATGDKLDFAVGKGDDKDIPKVVFVMDTDAYPSFVAEQYHQFHDGFNFGENYPASYNRLASMFAKSGESFGSCPNGALGVGIGGL